MPLTPKGAAIGFRPAADQDICQDHLAKLAEHTLEFFRDTAANALEQLGETRPQAETVLAVFNTLTSEPAIRNLERINAELVPANSAILILEPAIARIVVVDELRETRTYFISRATPAQPSRQAASYRSPIGRLAALPVGSDYDLVTPNGSRTLEVVERATLRAKIIEQQWDSVNSTVEAKEFRPLTIKSFRQLLRSAAAQRYGLDLLEEIIAEDRDAINVIEGLRRSAIAKMELRDQPLLDQYQDEIFRLPLDTQIAILGPPGTGKTTTLIKRLGLKLDPEYLSDEERDMVTSTMAGSAGHSQSWLMFTPTDLLKQYVKEAFGRENIAASDLRIQTWADYRRELARNRFGILRTATGTGSFVMKEKNWLNHSAGPSGAMVRRL